MHVEVAAHQEAEHAADALTARVQHRSSCSKAICVAGSLASALAHAGDARAADAIAKAARASMDSMDAVKEIKSIVNSGLVSGWSVHPLPQEPLKSRFPCLLHVEGRDATGRLDRAHAITVMADMIFDANHANVLPLTEANLHACIPGADYKFHRVIRGFQAVPSKKARHGQQRSNPLSATTCLSLQAKCVCYAVSRRWTLG